MAGLGRTARTALAGWLVCVLLAATACAASETLHQSLHRDGAAEGHFCLVCFFAKGQVSAEVVAVVSVIAIFYCLGSVRLASAAVAVGFDYRLSPSRAPPRS
jgi:hypothetical protein